MNEVYKMYGGLLQVYTDRRMDPIIVVFKVTMTKHVKVTKLDVVPRVELR